MHDVINDVIDDLTVRVGLMSQPDIWQMIRKATTSCELVNLAGNQ